jgi:hypothetical protein
MLKRLLFLLILCLVPGALALAQQTDPPPVLKALEDLNFRTGQHLTLRDFKWRWQQKVYDDTSLGCPLPGQNAQTYQKGAVIGYQVEFDLKGVTWDYRVSGDLSILVLCSPQATPTPTVQPTRLPPTLFPTNTPGGNASPTPTFCPGSPMPRLSIGGRGRVVPGGVPNNVRQTPGQSSKLLGELQPDRMFYVLDGPRCFSGLSWWFVADSTSPLEGWTPEGLGNEYWLEPVNELGTPVITPTTTPEFAFPTNTPVVFELNNQPTLPPPPPGATALPPTPLPTLAPNTGAVVCNQNLPPRLFIGGRGRVTPGLPNNIRQGPGSSTKYVGEIPVGGALRFGHVVVAGELQRHRRLDGRGPGERILGRASAVAGLRTEC